MGIFVKLTLHTVVLCVSILLDVICGFVDYFDWFVILLSSFVLML